MAMRAPDRKAAADLAAARIRSVGAYLFDNAAAITSDMEECVVDRGGFSIIANIDPGGIQTVDVTKTYIVAD